jgi:glucose/arabinose dehydrogenase
MKPRYFSLAFSLLCAPLLIASGCGGDDNPVRADASRDGARDGTAGMASGDGGALDAASDGGGTTGTLDGGGGGDGAHPPDAFMIAADRPARRDFSPALLQQLRVPAGFKVSVYASNMGSPRMLALGPGGAVYVTNREPGEVVRLFDSNGDGDADDAGERRVVVSRMDNPELAAVHGLAISGTTIYLATTTAVFSATIAGDGGLSGLRKIADLPDGGQHPYRTLAVGPDGKLYITVGSTCNSCAEMNSEHGTFLRVETSGAMTSNPPQPAHSVRARDPMAMVSPRVWASGLRNTLGFDWHPTTHEMWGFDQGSDGLGDDIPPEELNHLVGGKAYGWPYCWADRRPDPTVDVPKNLNINAYCATTEPVVAPFQAHSSPIGLLFYTASQFPAAYRNDAFIAFRGSWNRSFATGYKVVRIHFADGMPANVAGTSSPFEDFLSGFLIENGAAHFGRVAGLAVDGTGALLVAEDTNGMVYRVSYGGAGTDGGATGGGDGGAPADAAADAPAADAAIPDAGVPDLGVDLGTADGATD